MKSIKTVLNTYLFKTGLDVGVNQQQAVNLWPTAVGKKIAEKAINEIPNIYKEQGIIAEVHSNNTASHRLFSRAGFIAISSLAYCLKIKK